MFFFWSSLLSVSQPLFIIIKEVFGYVNVKLSRFILLETRGPGVFSINQSRDPCKWGSRSKSQSQTQLAVQDSKHTQFPWEQGQRKEEGDGVNKVNPKKQHSHHQGLLKALFCFDTSADQRPSSALEKQAFMKTLQIGFHRLCRLLPQ